MLVMVLAGCTFSRFSVPSPEFHPQGNALTDPGSVSGVGDPETVTLLLKGTTHRPKGNPKCWELLLSISADGVVTSAKERRDDQYYDFTVHYPPQDAWPIDADGYDAVQFILQPPLISGLDLKVFYFGVSTLYGEPSGFLQWGTPQDDMRERWHWEIE